MVPPRTGKAAVEIVADVANFGSKVERDLNRELKNVKLDVRDVADGLSKGIDKGVTDAGKSFDGLDKKAKTTLGGIGTEADQIGTQIGEGVRKGTGRAREELGRFVKSGKETSTRFRLGFGNLSVELGGIGAAAGLALTSGLKGAALISAANTASQLVVALAPAVGALGVLPAAFIAAKVAAGAFKIAMIGVSDAVAAGVTGDTAAFNKALEGMPAPAQAAIKEIVGLKKEILGVRTAVQGAFFEPLIGAIKPLGEILLPMVGNQLARVSAGFGAAAASTAQLLNTPANIESIWHALDNTGTAINNLSAGVPGLVAAFLPLWEVGSSFLPGLTAEFDTVTERIANFMKKAQETGQLKDFLSSGLSVLGQLGSILGDVGSILKSVFQAASASGGDLLGVVGQAVGAFASFLNTAEGMSALTSVFEVLGGVAGLFGQALQIVLPVLGDLVGVLAGALKPLLPVISAAIKQLAPVIATVGQALGAILGPAIGVVVQLLATLLPVVIPIVQTLTAQLLPIIVQMMPAVMALGQVIGQVLVQALTALMPAFMQLLPVLLQIVTAVMPQLLPLIAQLGTLFAALMPALTPLIALLVQLITMALKPYIATLPLVVKGISMLVTVFTAIVGPVASAIGWFASLLTRLAQTRTIAGNAVMAFNTIKSAISVVFGYAKNYVIAVWNSIKTTTSAVWGFIKNYITAQINTVKTVLNSIGAAITAVVGFFTRLRAQASSALGSFRSAVSSAVSAVIGFFGRLASGAQGKINSLLATVRGIGGRIRSAVGNLAGLLVSAGANVIQGLINGISSKLGALRSKAASAASAIRNLFPFSPAKEGPLSGKGSPEIAGGKIATMISAGMQRRIPEVQRTAIRLAKAAQKTASGKKAPHLKKKGKIRKDGTKGAPSPAQRGRDTAKKKKTTPTRTVSGDGDNNYTFQAGSIVLNFHGVAPTPAVATAVGRAAGQGLIMAFNARDVRTTVRTI